MIKIYQPGNETPIAEAQTVELANAMILSLQAFYGVLVIK